MLSITGQAQAGDKVDSMAYSQLISEADKAIKNGQAYSSRWGDASSYLVRLCYEIVERAFTPYRSQVWALYVVRRESGCNPKAINSVSGTTGIAQIHPRYHTWIDYARIQVDMRYAIFTFLRLSKNGRNTQPWCLC